MSSRDPGQTAGYRYLFGPVPSRRLGRSLGVDLLPRKTCTFNCVFCQVGRAGPIAALRREYVPTRNVIAELRRWVASNGRADTVTLSGSGEPT
jgi:wyosine [tRNA(Phe)-imidazoG37] synthetase (radical SAM superfamily)